MPCVPPPDNAVTITFDDGLECFYRKVFPVLKYRSCPTTLFAVVYHMNATNKWMQSRDLPARRLMTRDEPRATMSADAAIGCHSAINNRLIDQSEEELHNEVTSAKIHLAYILGLEVRDFSYPNGGCGYREQEAVIKAGYKAAYTTLSGYNKKLTDLFLLRRIDLYVADIMQHFRRKLDCDAN